MTNTYTLDINSSLKANDWLLIELTEPIKDLTKLYTILFNYTPTNATVQVEYRWSKDADVWTEWKAWPAPSNTFSGEFVWLGFRLKSTVNISVKTLSLEWKGGELGNENSPCTCKVTACGSGSDNSFLTNCNTSALYNFAFAGIPWFENLTCAIFNNLGWPVIYFKVDEVEESRDVIFKEWSLLKVSECKQIKVIVPGNNFGSGEFQFNEMDIDFSDEVEIQIHKESFWASFGAGEQPAEKDFLYFPLERRMYRLNSVQSHKGYMRQVMWWKATLVKWNESDSILKSDKMRETIEDLTLDFEDVGFDLLQQTEELDVTKPQQYTVRRIADSDKCRDTINLDWEKGGVIERNLDNYYTVFSKFQYDLKFSSPTPPPPIPSDGGFIGATDSTPIGATAADYLVTYQNAVDTDSNFSVMFWYYPKKRANNSAYLPDEWITLFGDEIHIDIKSNLTSFTGLRIDSNEWAFTLPAEQWYAIYLGYNKDHNELTLRIWTREDINNKTTKMKIVYESTIKPIGIMGEWNVGLNASGDEIACIRFLKEVMTLENQAPAFNKLVFREDSKAYIVDDCYPLSYLGFLSAR